LLITPIDKRR